ncbi:uncharacterized protein LAESUDRAFT_811538 [Laetiporus sulphureus 93-53]|uniref:DNA repair protein Rad26 n=1 Tax=Laetiporus sulphureus 93-53 TaxID=1314785 RepID=A0A165F6N7_9APHY|nr:uncharacterized protein LAESUDRAFT_811538 [Laetiporus sulphureus 93-53]KZT08498.1 hypothetical protein LAESUDRAFT_811538 [Laetiporus sulphureus 93-53]
MNKDSDDDLFEDIDDSTIAIFDDEDAKYRESQISNIMDHSQPTPPIQPPAKRQKIAHPRTVFAKAKRTADLNDEEDEPDILISRNGSYKFGNSAQGASGSRPNGTARRKEVVGSGENAGASNEYRSRSENRQQQHIAPTNRPAGNLYRTNSNSITFARQPSIHTPNGDALHRNHDDHDVQSRQLEDPGHLDEGLQRELETLRAQLNQLRQEQQHVQQSLKAAEDARLAKEGEVSILRKSIERTTKQHAAEVARIKAAKEAAEATQLQIQKEMKEEMDRLKTQFTFKQHELETSIRNSPWSIRGKKIGKQVPLTPVRMPSQMRNWNTTLDKAGPSLLGQQVMNGSDLFSIRIGNSPRKARASVEKPKKFVSMPGFVNAFDPAASPTRSPSQSIKGKGKQRAEDPHRTDQEAIERNFFTSQHRSQRHVSPPRRPQTPPSSPPLSSPIRGGTSVGPLPALFIQDEENDIGNVDDMHDADGDVNMADTNKADAPEDEGEEIVLPDWRAEVLRIILTHRMPPSELLTVQQLIGTSLSMASFEHQRLYCNLNKRLLESLGPAVIPIDDVDRPIGIILDILISLADLLQQHGAFAPLIGLLNLLQALAYRLPSFARLVLASHEHQGNLIREAPSPTLTTLCGIIERHFTPRKEAWDDELSALARETLGLLDVVIWTTPDVLASKFSVIPRGLHVLSNLLDPAHPTWLLHRSVRMLTLLASHHALFRDLLSFPAVEPTEGQQPATKDYSKIPHIEQMASYLRNTSLQGHEANMLKETILAFIAGVGIAHRDALAILLESQTLVLSIVVFLTNITTPLFEEDEALLRSPDMTRWTIEQTVRAVSLLYILVSSAEDSASSLRQKILNARYPQFHGIHHMIIVTLGRLTYAEPPQDVSTELRSMLDQAIDMSEEMLGLLVDGPEHELVFSAFQVPQELIGDNRTDLDDEEQEARMHHPPDSDTE